MDKPAAATMRRLLQDAILASRLSSVVALIGTEVDGGRCAAVGVFCPIWRRDEYAQRHECGTRLDCSTSQSPLESRQVAATKRTVLRLTLFFDGSTPNRATQTNSAQAKQNSAACSCQAPAIQPNETDFRFMQMLRPLSPTFKKISPPHPLLAPPPPPPPPPPPIFRCHEDSF
jgi:hypothetical protein